MMARMERQALPLSKLPQTTRLFADFLDNFPKVSEFYTHPPSGGGIMAAARQAYGARGTKAETLNAVVDIFRRQNCEFGSDESVTHKLDQLRDGAVAVVTGQQTALRCV